MAWNDNEKDMAVTLDGRVMAHGMKRKEAEAYAKMLADGLESHKAGTKVRQPEINIRPDKQVRSEMDHLYRTMKTHTMVTR